MTRSIEVECLADIEHLAVVRLHGHALPGSVVPGNVLARLHALAADVHDRALQSDDEALREAAERLRAELAQRLLHHRAVLIAARMPLPWAEPPGFVAAAQAGVVLPRSYEGSGNTPLMVKVLWATGLFALGAALWKTFEVLAVSVL